MADLAHDFGTDIVLAPDGDIALADGPALTRQRALRRLLTNPGAYIWDVNYGAGLGAMVGEAADAARIAAIVRAQMFLEATVARSPLPAVSVAAGADGVARAAVSYVDTTDGTAQNLAVVPPGS